MYATFMYYWSMIVFRVIIVVFISPSVLNLNQFCISDVHCVVVDHISCSSVRELLWCSVYWLHGTWYNNSFKLLQILTRYHCSCLFLWHFSLITVYCFLATWSKLLSVTDAALNNSLDVWNWFAFRWIWIDVWITWGHYVEYHYTNVCSSVQWLEKVDGVLSCFFPENLFYNTMVLDDRSLMIILYAIYF